MAKPNPVPPCRRVTVASACRNGSKMRSSLSAATPSPVSWTSTANRAGRSAPSSPTPAGVTSAMRRTDPSAVNLTALPTRLMSTCRSRSGSVTTAAGAGPTQRPSKVSPLSAAFTRSALSTSAITACGSHRRRANSIRPASTLERSRMSLMRASRCLPLPEIVSRCSSRSARVPPPARSTSAKPRIAFRGVRISWDMFARNSLFCRSASRAASRSASAPAAAARRAARSRTVSSAMCRSSFAPRRQPQTSTASSNSTHAKCSTPRQAAGSLTP